LYQSIAFNDRALKYRIYRKARRIYDTLFARVNEKPIFILGNQKSGTTVIALLLADATLTSVTIDLFKEIYDPEFQHLFQHPGRFAGFIKKNRADFSRNFVKEPNLTLFFPFLKERFPHAKFVMVVRDPRDNIRSILDRLQLSGTLDDSVEDIRPAISEAWSYVLDNRWYLDCGDHYIDSLSARWNYMADIYLDHRDDIHLVRYEDFRKDKIGAIQQLTSAIGLPVRNDITPLVNRQFQRKGNHRKLDVRHFFSPENLRRIERVCAQSMAALGYDGKYS